MFRHLALHDLYHAYRVEQRLLNRWDNELRGMLSKKREKRMQIGPLAAILGDDRTVSN